MTFISRLCTNRVPPEAIRAWPIALDTSARPFTAAGISASSRSISLRNSSISAVWWLSTISMFISANSAFSSCGGSGLIRYRASQKRRAPNPEADHGALRKQLDHGHRWPVPVEKSAYPLSGPLVGRELPTALRVEHEPSVPLRASRAQKRRGKPPFTLRGAAAPVRARRVG